MIVGIFAATKRLTIGLQDYNYIHMRKFKRALIWTIAVALSVLIFIAITGGDPFDGDNLPLSFIFGFLFFGLPSLFFQVKDKKETKSKNNAETSRLYRPQKAADYWNPQNIPSHWVKARACVDGDHDGTTVSGGDATRCFKCGRPFEGSWGDRGVFDGYFCQVHKKWIPRGDYCLKCKNEGLIP